MAPTRVWFTPEEVRAAWIKWSTFLATYLINIWGVTTLIWGNLSVYTSSYFYSRVKDPGEVQTPWPVSFFFICWALGMLMAKTLYDCLGRRLACLVGILLVDGGLLLSYLTVQHSVMALAMTMGVAVGIGCGINSSITLVTVVEWTDKYFGLSTASTTAAVSIGSVISNQMLTLFVNPDNLRPDHYTGKVRYFSQPEIIDRVPSFFILLGSASLCLNLIGLAFLLTRNKRRDGESAKLLDDSESEDVSSSVTNEDEGASIIYNPSVTTEADCADGQCRLSTGELGGIDEEDGIDSSEEENNNNCGYALTVVDYTPREILKTGTFYILSFAVMVCDLTFLTVTTYYKAFGLVYINDDHFMTDIGTSLVGAISIFSCMSGFVTDNIQLKTALMVSTSLLTMTSAFYFFMPRLNKWLFAIATLLYGGTMYFNYSLFIVGTLKIFGQKYYSTNYGLVTVSGVLINVATPPLVDTVVKTWGWFYLFLSIGVANGVSLVLVAIGFPLIKRPGKKMSHTRKPAS